MRLAGEIILVLAVATAVGFALVHKSAVNHVIVTGGQPDPVMMARLMQLPFQGAMIAVPICIIGLTLIAVGITATPRTRRTAPG